MVQGQNRESQTKTKKEKENQPPTPLGSGRNVEAEASGEEIELLKKPSKEKFQPPARCIGASEERRGDRRAIR